VGRPKPRGAALGGQPGTAWAGTAWGRPPWANPAGLWALRAGTAALSYHKPGFQPGRPRVCGLQRAVPEFVVGRAATATFVPTFWAEAGKAGPSPDAAGLTAKPRIKG